MTPWLLVVGPAAAAPLILLGRRFSAFIATAALVAVSVVGVWAAATEASSELPWGSQLALTASVTGFARVMVVLVPVIALPITIYAALTEDGGRTKLIALLVAFVGAMELLVVAGDFLTLLIGWELVGSLSWVLIAHNWRASSNVQMASHAFITTRFGDLGLYVAAGALFAATGSFSYDALSDVAPERLGLVAAGVLVAAAAKSAQPPFAPWLFSAMAGPTPVSALLHSSTMVAAGAYLLIRLAPSLEPVSWFGPSVVAVGLAGALGGGIVASIQRHPKRLLAGSTTAQYGLMFIGIGAGSVTAGAAQLVTHAAFKSLLFLSAGTAMHASGSDDVATMRLGRRLPAIAAITAVGAMALAALPPIGGAWSKEQIVAVAFEPSLMLGLGVIAAGFLSAFYAGRYWLLAYGRGDGPEPRSESPRETFAMAVLAVFSLALSVLWIPMLNEKVAAVVGSEVVDARAWELGVGIATLAAAAAVIVLSERRGRLADAISWRVAAFASDWFGIARLSRVVVIDPVLSLSRALAAFDDRVIDAGVRASARVARGFSRLFDRRWELSIDAVVNAIAGGTLVTAGGSRMADDGVDATIEGVASSVGRGGALLRRLQTGLSHHYYLIVTVGIVAIIAALAAGVS